MAEDQGSYVTETQEAMDMLNYDGVRVKDESNDRKYFTITPRIVKAYARNAHDLALWETVKDITGESGECYLNTEQLGVLAGISAGQVSNSRKYWLKIGFLKGEIRKDPGYSQAVWHLTVPDLWAKNIEYCEKYPKIADRLQFRLEHKSLHRMKASPSEGKPSPHETKKKLIKKIYSDEEEDATGALFRTYESEIGAITPVIADAIEGWVKDGFPAKWIEDAIKEAAKANARSWRYVEAIIKRWNAQGNQNPIEKPTYQKGNRANANTQPSSTPPVYTQADYEIAAKIRAARGLS